MARLGNRYPCISATSQIWQNNSLNRLASPPNPNWPGFYMTWGNMPVAFRPASRTTQFTALTTGLREPLVLPNYASTAALLPWTVITPEYQRWMAMA